ncbi:Rab GTPase activating protein, putative [Entamoeba histolytica HM-1:IMSS-B]|uniref:Rab GTPase activating protein, putative n=6 Tax=Entamoeba histolytica TaxID=5759 RepID=C4M687_ENTH1|nr:Rab GTPase activating protein, putative [Entamoeba histolytica HM-1:IMSS]EMD49324.1 Rab GTPase activating protein, putative [Entamoeba histolytica KU27]EMH76148.1 Rab GTPase activating protein, putative [Entamoeba histolytica HM-1:IMSS-B]EMS16033.1 Rab GTPase activating protein, putative [Entamoeba histolytica HM-3:IMSS]ENY59758.1 Rab GTPase activating protein, putative [Entamoeba histolytica HM-1:IMSS-A]GAT96975.1 Rab GTPase activating protein putative [Entamoeba histolytica]|eukprot:XP_652019.2 Rab GTPase activating protein, putative [Entamoeba histolytica HM-1:IMSS]
MDNLIYRGDNDELRIERNDTIVNDIYKIRYDNFIEMKDEDGRINEFEENELRTLVKYHGSDETSRVILWEMFLGILKFSSTEEERNQQLLLLKNEYDEIKKRWNGKQPEEMDEQTKKRYKRDINIICKDVQRTDRDNVLFKDLTSTTLKVMFDVLVSMSITSECGYGQGMSDIVALIIQITYSEFEVFYLFQGILELVKEFYGEEGRISSDKMMNVGNIICVVDEEFGEYLNKYNITFEFIVKWLLMLFKREFWSKEVLRLWDSFISFPKDKLYLFLSATILIKNRLEIMNSQMRFDDLFIWTLKLEHKIPLQYIYDADNLLYEFRMKATPEQQKRVFN